MFVLLQKGGELSTHATAAHTYTNTHGLSHVRVPSKHSFPSVTFYLAFSGLGWTAPHETLINNPQVLLPVVHFEAVDMRAACGTHGSHSIRVYCPLGDETCSNPSTQTQSKRAGWLACQVRCPPIAALRLTGHVLVAVTETPVVASINFFPPIFRYWTWNMYAFKSRIALYM